jgi:hypothetical protein
MQRDSAQIWKPGNGVRPEDRLVTDGLEALEAWQASQRQQTTAKEPDAAERLEGLLMSYVVARVAAESSSDQLERATVAYTDAASRVRGLEKALASEMREVGATILVLGDTAYVLDEDAPAVEPRIDEIPVFLNLSPYGGER